jgi:hypothetical protein
MQQIRIQPHTAPPQPIRRWRLLEDLTLLGVRQLAILFVEAEFLVSG